jgi:hypothetical protein
VHFPEQDAAAIDDAIDRELQLVLTAEACRARALEFDQAVFRAKIRAAADYMLTRA